MPSTDGGVGGRGLGEPGPGGGVAPLRGPRTPASITVQQLVDAPALALSLVAGAAGHGNVIKVPRIQKPGLALAGYPEQLHSGRVLVLGGTEIDYLAAAPASARALGLGTVMASRPACVVVCRGLPPVPDLVRACEAERVPLVSTSLTTADFIVGATGWMGDRLAARTEVHGVLVDVLGVGLLVLGQSGIGKSETALDLVVRGHRLVADDVVDVWRRGDVVIGAGVGLIRHHMEIRGLGIINIQDLFGVSAVRDTKRVELVVELVEWNDADSYDRLGIDDPQLDVLGVSVPMLRLPVRPGRDLATLLEVAARNQLLKARGRHSARELTGRLGHALTHPGQAEVEPAPLAGAELEAAE